MNWRVFWGTVGKYYSIAYSITFGIWVLMNISGVDANGLHFGQLDAIFAIWTLGSALWKSNS
jgi:hypothetical protein